jgi:tRNA 2-thiocytidine biosynthesis protein TtcA
MQLLKEKVDFKGVVKCVYKKMGKAIADYKMLKEKDKILIGVSGGFDSLSLLRLFQMRKERIPIDFDIIACFVETNFIKINKEVLTNYFNSIGIKYVIKELALDKNEVNCFWCSWNRRKVLFETARDYNCNKVALGHNLDDIIETTLLNLFFLGEISTMKPKVELFRAKLAIIRPLCYVEKREINNLASKFSFPDTQYECFYGKDSRRRQMKDLIGSLYSKYPFIKSNIFRALGRIKKDYLI